jgi:hypothetical protein
MMMKRKAILRVCAVYSLLVWLYVVGLQFVYGWQSVYYYFASWIPIRTDYVGEAAFVLSFILSLLSYGLHEENKNET